MSGLPERLDFRSHRLAWHLTCRPKAGEQGDLPPSGAHAEVPDCASDRISTVSTNNTSPLTWWLWRGGCTRSHSELGRETPLRRWYFVLRRGRVGRCQVCRAVLPDFCADAVWASKAQTKSHFPLHDPKQNRPRPFRPGRFFCCARLRALCERRQLNPVVTSRTKYQFHLVKGAVRARHQRQPRVDLNGNVQ
jgi:hypothetical protein